MTKLYSLSYEIWLSNYQYKDENTVIDTWRRIARGAASVEKDSDKEEVEKHFFNILSDFRFVPGGRILANLGTDRKSTTLMNCFVHAPRDIGYIDPDSIEGIYEMLKSQAQTLKSEGGYGMNFSWIRPRGAYIGGIDSRTPGVLKFMELWDKSSEIITLGSEMKTSNEKDTEKKKIRKGAMMGVLSCFSDNTLILTNTGWMNIIDVIRFTLSGISLYAICEDGNMYLIKNPIINEPEMLYEVEAEDGTIIEVTGNHEFEVLNTETNEVYLKAIKDVNPEIELVKVISILDEK